jgi:hypothetical protein
VPDHKQLLEIIDRDIREGIGKVFTPTGPVRLQRAFADVTLPDAKVSFVPWEYDAVHDQPMHAAMADGHEQMTHEHGGSPMAPATHKQFTIAGVTVVDARTRTVTLHRFVDWANVLGNVGMHMSMRPSH